MDVPALDDASGSCSSSRAHEFAFRMKQGGLVMFKSGECWHGSTKVHYGGEDVSAKTGAHRRLAVLRPAYSELHTEPRAVARPAAAAAEQSDEGADSRDGGEAVSVSPSALLRWMMRKVK